MREFGLYRARIEGNKAFGDIDTADMYVVWVCEISFFLKRNSHEFCIRQKEKDDFGSEGNGVYPGTQHVPVAGHIDD